MCHRGTVDCHWELQKSKFLNYIHILHGSLIQYVQYFRRSTAYDIYFYGIYLYVIYFYRAKKNDKWRDCTDHLHNTKKHKFEQKQM